MKTFICCFALIVSACGTSTNKRLEPIQVQTETTKQRFLRHDINVINKDLSKLPSDSLNDSERVYLQQFKEGLIQEYNKKH